MSTVALGIVLGLAGSIAINTGNNLQSRGMYMLEKNERESGCIDKEDAEDGKIDACNSKMWISGTVIFLTGALLNFASYGFAPQSMLATLESIQFVTNLFLGKVLQQKEITWRMYVGTFVTVGGTLMAVSFSPKEGATIEVISDLVRLWENGLWISYLVLISASALALYLTNNFYEGKEKSGRQSFKNTIAVIYAVFSALYGTLSVVFAKLLAELLDLQTQGISIFTNWFTYITLLCWLVLTAFWLIRLNNALILFSPLLIIPLLQVNFIFFAIISGGIYFKEFNHMLVHQWVGFIFGVAFMFLGIYFTIPHQHGKNMVISSRRSTINRRQRQFSEIFMSGASRLNHNEYSQRLIYWERNDKSVSLQPYIVSKRSEAREEPDEGDKEPQVFILKELKRPSKDKASVKRPKPIRVESNEPLKFGGNRTEKN